MLALRIAEVCGMTWDPPIRFRVLSGIVLHRTAVSRYVCSVGPAYQGICLGMQREPQRAC